MNNIMSGALVAEKLKSELKQKIQKMTKPPQLVVISVGDNSASKIYIKNKARACEEVGINSIQINLSSKTTQKELLEKIEFYNNNKDVHGILVQLPLPSHIDEKLILDSISPDKDVDCFHAVNMGKLLNGTSYMAPCTAQGIITLLDYYKINIDGKNCVVVGRSNIVGKPVAALLLEKNGTVTVCHSHTKNLENFTKEADILVCAVGKEHFITADMVKPGAVVIDVGINRNKDGKICGDVDFDSVSKIASYITPVPGGVGPMTVTELLCNTYLCGLCNEIDSVLLEEK